MSPSSMPAYRSSVAQRDVTVHFFKLGGKSGKEAGIYDSQGRDDYDADDVEHYFNYMGMLAVEGTYDRMYAQRDAGIHPADVLLLWACQENDAPKVEELLDAGADLSVRNLDGKSPMDLATKPEILVMLKEYAAKNPGAHNGV
jgi:hypothetical protein